MFVINTLFVSVYKNNNNNDLFIEDNPVGHVQSSLRSSLKCIYNIYIDKVTHHLRTKT